MKKNIFIVTVFLLSGLTSKEQSQNNLDTLLLSLNNKDLYIAPILYVPSGTATQQKGANYDSIRANRRLFAVSSLEEDIQVLAKRYSKEILIEKLYALLNDPARDLYANALLYDLIDNRKLGKLSSMNREKWVNSGREKADAVVWKEYIQKNINTY